MRSFPELALASSIFFCLTACGSAIPAPDAPGKSGAPNDQIDPGGAPVAFPAPLRLPEGATPRSYELTLRIDPAATTFSGRVRIAVDLAAPTRLIRLHADGLAITTATAIVGSQSISLSSQIDDTDLALIAPKALSGALTLEIAWQGPLPEAPVGIYRVQEGGRWYVFTQFEPLEARRAFPSFDEPRFKTPFSTTLEVPKGYTPFSNDPELAATATADGWMRHTFAPTKPLPTYLVAFAIGDFDVVEGGKVSGGKVPFRIITAKGKGHLAGFALDRGARHLAMQEAWFGSPYPFAKLDFVAVPSFSSSGMENAGLITYREALLLTSADASMEDRAWCESLIAHEIAHMWVGDLVTMHWWDDLWLNEAFAVWMARKSVAAISPELDAPAQALRSKFNVMGADARAHARAVRQPIDDSGDIYNAFDGITYSKGAALLTMLEAWMGAARFQAGVRSYLAAHAWGTAKTDDLLSHLSREARTDVGQLVASFLDQPGVPLVSVDWRCEAAGAVSIDVQQRPYRALGDPRGPLTGVWQIPMCVRLSDGKKTFDHCSVLGEPSATWRINPGFCPTFSHPNIDEAGYYRWQTRLGPISIARGDKAAFAGYVASLRAGVDSGTLALAELIDGVSPLFEASISPAELDDLIGALGQIPRFDPDAPRDARYQKKARALLDKIPLDLGLGDSPHERRRQPSLVRALAGHTRDPRVFRHAAKIGESFVRELEGHNAIKTNPEDVTVYLSLYVNSLGREPRDAKKRADLWQRLRAAFDKVRDPNERDLVIEALASFDDPELLIKSYDLLLDGTLRAQDLRTLRSRTSGRPEVTDALWTWLTTNFDAVVAKLGAKSAPSLPGFANAYCTNEAADKVAAFFESRKESLPNGINRPLAQTLDGIRACAIGRERYAAEARAWYAKK